MSEFVNPTNCSLSDLITGSPNPKEATDILTKWYSAKIGVDPSAVKTIIIDGNNVFPVFHVDKLSDMIARYAKLYPIEARATVEYVTDCKRDNPDGNSKSHLLRSIMQMPTILKAAITSMYGEKWFTEKDNVRTMARLMPKFFTCNTDKL